MTYQTYFMEKKSSFKLKTKINKILTLIFTCVSVAHISIQWLVYELNWSLIMIRHALRKNKSLSRMNVPCFLYTLLRVIITWGSLLFPLIHSQTDLQTYVQCGGQDGHCFLHSVVQTSLQTFCNIRCTDIRGYLILGARQLPHVAPSSTRVIKIRVTITTVNFILPTKRN